MNDGLPFLAEFVTYEGKCAVCGHRSEFSRWCYIKGENVRKDDSCDSFKEKMKL